MQLVRQVGDHCGDVREAPEAEEGGTALEVDQHEVQLVRRVGGDQAQYQRPQQLALPRPRGADAQAVGPAAALGGLLEVQRHRHPRVVHPDRHTQPGRRLAAAVHPQHLDGLRGDCAGRTPREAEQLGQARGRLRPGQRAGTRGPVPGEPAGQRGGLGDRQGIRPADGTDAAGPVRPRQLVRPDEQAHHGGRRPPAGWRPHPQHRRARDRGPRAGAGRVVDDNEQVRLRRSGARGPARESASHQCRTSSARAVIIRIGPTASRSRGCAACGSHLTHSHSGAR